ncbi:cobalamin biosynthesis protein CobG [Paracoccus sp. (in: a-proteobacteria)]|uniref:cobalamin biosynthesis protein CobG n=1 Tax=Paracoccus sp. TaxID=267 RepID=UPI00321F9AFE
MSGGPVKGWCPGALTPMPAQDGLILRIRPHAARLAPEQGRALADLAARFARGRIELTSRANLQLRGVRAADLAALQAGLRDAGLLDPDPETERRRNILCTPLWRPGDGTLALADELRARLAELPALPAKFGFAIDTGPAAVLGRASADLRLERAPGGLILRAEGMAAGEPVAADAAIDRLIALAHWFARHAGKRRRMAQLVAEGLLPLRAEVAPLTAPVPAPGATPFGALRALPLGQIAAATLQALAVAPLRLTPWRALLLESAPAAAPDLIADPLDPRLRLAACIGRAGCAAATVETRALALGLAHLLPAGALLHVSGCAKGCAHPGPATITLTGRDGRFDLIRGGRAGDAPLCRDLHPDDLSAILRDHDAPSL